MKHLTRYIITGLLCISALYPSTLNAQTPNVVQLTFLLPEISAGKRDFFIDETNRYFSPKGDITIQFLTSTKNLNIDALKERPSLLITSGIYATTLLGNPTLTPILIANRKGTRQTKKILVTQKRIVDISQLSPLRIATTGALALGKQRLTTIAMENQLTISNTLNITTVSKELDALLMVGNNEADACVVSEETLSTFALLSPSYLSQLIALPKNIYESNPIVYSDRSHFNLIIDSIQILRHMHGNQQGKQLLEFIGYDNWESYEKKPPQHPG